MRPASTALGDVAAFPDTASVPMSSVHARASGYFVAGVVLLGMLLSYALPHFTSGLHRPLQAGLVVIAIAAVVAARSRRRPVPLVLLATPLLLALVDLAAYVNVGFSSTVLETGLQRYLCYFLLAIFVYYSSFGEREMQLLLTIMGSVFLVVAIVAAVQFSSGKWLAPFTPSQYQVVVRLGFFRAQGFLTRPNDFALFVGFWFFLFYCRAGRSGRALFYSVVCAAMGASILLSVTRTAIVGIAALVFLLELRHLSVRARVVVCVVVVMLATVLGLGALRGVAKDVSTIRSSWRAYYLAQGLRVWEHNPLVGVGFDRYATDSSSTDNSTPDVSGQSVLEEYHIQQMPIGSSDAFLANILPEFGLIGAGVALVAFVLLVKAGLKRSRVDLLTGGYLCCLFFGVVSMFTSASGLFASYSLALWISVGMLARCLHSSRRVDGVDSTTIARAE